MTAVVNRHVATSHFLLNVSSLTALVTEDQRGSVLEAAAGKGLTSIVDRLGSIYRDIDGVNEALSLAAKFGHTETARAILKFPRADCTAR